MKLKKPLSHYMRILHRDIGFFVIGLTIIFSISGIMLIFRETGFLKQEAIIEKQVPPDTEPKKVGFMLHIRDFKVNRTEGNTVYFNKGTYDKSTGTVKYTAEVLPAVLDKFNDLHKASDKKFVHWFSMLYGISLLFLAVSSIWMFSMKSKMFRRGICIAGSGLIFALAVLLI